MVETTSSLIQKAQVFDHQPTMNLVEACSPGNGILRLDEEGKKAAFKAFSELSEKVSFFIPASGSGSRMFDDVFKFSQSGTHNEGSRKFFDAFQDLAIFKSLSQDRQKEFDSMSEVEIAEYVLQSSGLNLMRRPKGLIPFHATSKGILNAFQEHVLQISELFNEQPNIHFSLQDGFQDEVSNSIFEVVDQNSIQLDFSIQNRNTDAFCFDENKNLVTDDGIPLRRPAGHGSLLVNLNEIDSDLILIKNIDNIQHLSKSQRSNETWKLLIGTLKEFQENLIELKSSFSLNGFRELNRKYQFVSENQPTTLELLSEIIARPIRVCGMVRNEGDPGGGPFWIEKSGEITKQIVEKVQISSDPKQQEILSGSSHFNPVMIVASKNDLNGNRLDLHQFSNDEEYLVVKKPYDGKTIYYRELPGLWNGGMYYWNTIFVEISSDVFSPVKSVLDLRAKEHLTVK